MRKKTAEKLERISKLGYEDIGSSFDVTRKKYSWPEIDCFIRGISSGDSIIDIGCGNGRLFPRLPRGIKYLGVDTSQSLIRTAKINFPEARFENLDGANMASIDDEKFDWAFSLAVWHHFAGERNKIKFLNEIARVIKPGGRVIISVWDILGNKHLRWRVFKSRFFCILSLRFNLWNDIVFPWRSSDGKIIGMRYYHIFSPKEIRKIFALSNLSLISLEKSGGNYWLEAKRK